MNLEQALLTMQQIIDGLLALHSKEIAFVNLETDNIMITDVQKHKCSIKLPSLDEMKKYRSADP